MTSESLRARYGVLKLQTVRRLSAHRTARLNQFGRQLLIDRVVRDGWTVATAAEAQGISRATGHKWVRRYRLEGAAGLADRSSRPHRSPPAQDVQRIVAARREWRWGPPALGDHR